MNIIQCEEVKYYCKQLLQNWGNQLEISLSKSHLTSKNLTSSKRLDGRKFKGVLCQWEDHMLQADNNPIIKEHAKKLQFKIAKNILTHKNKTAG